MAGLEKVLGRCRQAVPGIAAGTAANGLVFAVFSELAFVEMMMAGGSVYVFFVGGTLLWTSYQASGFFRIRIENEKALAAQVVYRPEENLAHLANKYARRLFGQRRTITYKNYKPWRRKNPLLFTAVVGPERELFGFFDVFPLHDTIGKRILEGLLSETDIGVSHLHAEDAAYEANYIYIASIMSCVVNDHFDARLVEHLAEFLLEFYPPRPGRSYLAFAATEEGRKLLKRNLFILELNSNLTLCGRELYVLHSDLAPTSLRRLKSGRRKRARTTKAKVVSSILAESGKGKARELPT